MAWKQTPDTTDTEPGRMPFEDASPGTRHSFAESFVEAMRRQPFDDDQPHRRSSLRLMKLLLISVTLAAIIASVAVVWRMSDRPAASAPALVAHPGDCLNWPTGAPERAAVVNCVSDHVFEVADSEAVTQSSGPAPSSTDAGLRPEFQQKCTDAVDRYLGPRYDPGGRFVVGMVWQSTGVDRQAAGRLVCGLQLPSDGAASVPFRGRVADQDQSNVWPLGTCLGIRNGQPTEVVVDCASPHALEITGTEDLSNVFTQAAPSVEAQDSVVQDACTSLTTAYLAPTTLASTGLVLRYRPIEAAGWDTGTRKTACRIGFPKPDGSWATLVGDAETSLVVDGRPAAPPPPSPVEEPPTSTVDAAPPESSDDTTDSTEVGAPQESPTRTEAPVTVTSEAPSSPASQPHLAGSEAPGPQSSATESASPSPEQHLAGSEPASGPQPHLAGPGPAPGPPADQPSPSQPIAGQSGN
jgi:hypothetical protein